MHNSSKINFSKMIIFLFSISITFYAGKLTQFSPIYIIYLGLIPFSIAMLLKKQYLSYTFDMSVVLILFFYIIITQIQFMQSGQFINLFISLFAYLYIRLIKNWHGFDFYDLVFKYMIRISILTLSIDSIYRITHPIVPNMEDFEYIKESETLWFYIYKLNTVMFGDSNTTALIILVLFFSIVSIKNISLNHYKYEKYVLVLLLVSTISRSAYITFILSNLVLYFSQKNRKYKFIIYTLMPLFITIVSIIIFTIIENDASFNTKFNILFTVYENMKTVPMFNLLFGIGFGNVKEFLGIDTHLLFLSYFVEAGIVGLILISLFIGIYIYKYNSIVWLPMLIAGLSYFAYLGTPFLFIPLALLANMYDLKKPKFIKSSALIFKKDK